MAPLTDVSTFIIVSICHLLFGACLQTVQHSVTTNFISPAQYISLIA